MVNILPTRLFSQEYFDRAMSGESQTELRLIKYRLHNFCLKNSIGFADSYQFDNFEKLPQDKILSCSLDEQTFDLSYWQIIDQTLKKLGKQLFVVTDSIEVTQSFDQIKFYFYPELLSALVVQPTLTNTLPNRLYSCFSINTGPIEQSWLYFLYLNDLLDQGYVNFSMTGESSKYTHQKKFDQQHNQFLKDLPQFDKPYHALRDLVPYKNFNNNVIASAKFSLLLSENYTNDFLNSLQLPTIPLVFKCQYILKFKDLGFEFGTHMDNWNTLSWQDCQQEILSILSNNSIDFDQKRIYNQSQHNRDLILKWKQEYQTSGFFDQLYTEILSI